MQNLGRIFIYAPRDQFRDAFSYSPSLDVRYYKDIDGGTIWNFRNTFDRSCDEIRLDIQSRKSLRKSNLNEINTL
jgi:hypothetical protein